MTFKAICAAAFGTLAVGLSSAHALPVASDQAILADDKDANLFYFHPDRLVLASDSSTKRKMYGCFEDRGSAFVNAEFAFEMSDQLNQSIATLKKTNPNAKFAALPLKATRLVDQHVAGVTLSVCEGTGAMIGSLIPCTWQVSGAGACGAFKKAAAAPAGLHFLDFSFSFRAISQGQIKDVTRTLPVVILGVD